MNYYTTTDTTNTVGTATNQKDNSVATIIGIFLLIIVAIVCVIKGSGLVYNLREKKRGAEDVRKFIFWSYFANVFVGGFWGFVSGLVVEVIFKHKLWGHGVRLSREIEKSLTKKAILGIAIAFGAKIVFAIMLVAVVK